MPDEELITVRIPELADAILPISPDDLLVYWNAALNKTRRLSVSALAAYLASGGDDSAVPAPSVLGASFLHVVTALEAGGTTISIPSLAGQKFTLSRDGFPLAVGDDVTVNEYAILAAGGFKITIPGDVLVAGQRFFGQVYTLLGGTPTTTTSGGGSFITGKFPVVTNLPMTVADHINKLMQIRGGTTPLTITLPDLEDIPANTIIPFESSINNSYQSTITTRSAQNIYYNNGSFNNIYIGPGESLWLFRDDDGFYVMTPLPTGIGKITPSYKADLGELVCDGSLVQRAQWPRLWNYINTIGAGLVTDAIWLTASALFGGITYQKPFRGCFSLGDGTSTFRLPDLREMTLKGLKGGADAFRYANRAGGYQTAQVGETLVALNKGDAYTGHTPSPHFFGPGESENYQGTDYIEMNTDMENTVQNIGVIWTIKA